MENEKELEHTIKEILEEVVDEILINQEEDQAKHDELLEDYENQIRKGYDYYKAYKYMENVTDIISGVYYWTHTEEKQMVIENIKKIYQNKDYKSFVNEALKEDFTYIKFLELMKDEDNREIFKDLYLNGLKNLDLDYYNLTEEDVDEYIEKVEYDETVQDYVDIIEDVKLLVSSIFTIKDKTNRKVIMNNLKTAMDYEAKDAMEYINREHFLNRMKKVEPAFRLVTRVEYLPDDIFLNYVKYNGFKGLKELEYDQNRFPKDNIKDSMILEILDEHYDILDKRYEELNEIESKIEKRLGNIYKTKNIIVK